MGRSKKKKQQKKTPAVERVGATEPMKMKPVGATAGWQATTAALQAATEPTPPEAAGGGGGGGGGQEQAQMRKMLDVLSSSTFDEDLSCALASISGFVSSPLGGALFLHLDGVQRVLTLLGHTCADVREKSIGVIRNLVLSCKDEACKFLLENNSCLSSLTEMLKQVQLRSMNTELLSSIPAEMLSRETAVTMATVDLLSLICEECLEAADEIDLEFLFPFLVSLVGQCAAGLESVDELGICAARCLQIISEDNPNLLEMLQSSSMEQFTSELYQLVFFTNTASNRLSFLSHLLVLCLGVLQNVYDALPSELSTEFPENMYKFIAQVLSVKISELVSEEQGTREDVLHVCQAQSSALEILSNLICSASVNQETDMELDGDDDDDASDDDEGSPIAYDSDDVSDACTREVFMKLSALGIPDSVVAICHMVVVAETAEVKAAAQNVQNRAWLCLSNLLSLDLGERSADTCMSDLWPLLIRTLYDGGQVGGPLVKTDREFVDSISVAMRAIAEKVIRRSVVHEGRQVICCTDTVYIIESLLRVNNILESSKINLVNLLAMVGVANSPQDDSKDILLSIGGLLTGVLRSTSNLLLIAEVVDASVDTFADGCHVDVALRESELFALLVEVNQSFKQKIRGERNALGEENLMVVDTARLNLSRFIKYKQNNIR